MFNSVSMTGTGAVITLLEAIFAFFGIEAPVGSIAAGVNGVVAFLGLLWLVWGQLRRKDLTIGLFRK